MRPRAPRRAVMEDMVAGTARAFEAGFAVLALFLFSQAVVPLLMEGGAGEGATAAQEGNMVLRLMFSSLHAVTLALLALRWRASWGALVRNWSVVLLVVLAIASVAWSAAPDLTLRRSLAFLGTSACGVWLASRYELRTILRLLAVALGIAAVLSVVFALGLPSYGVDHEVHVGAWQGVYTEKNTLGQMMAIGAIVFVLVRMEMGRHRWVATAGALLCVALVLLSTAKTALAVLVIVAMVAAVSRPLRWNFNLGVAVVTGAVVVAGMAGVWLIGNLEGALTAMGKDPTLTGRTPMWNTLISTAMERPALGHGYSAFWLGKEGASGRALEAIGWDTPGAHNGYIDLALQLGLAGLIIFAAGFALHFGRSVTALRTTRAAHGFWPLLFLTFMLLYNFTETMLASGNNVFWVLYVATGCSFLLRRGAPEAAPAPVAPEPGLTPVQYARARRLLNSRTP
ncbi:MAG TPA: O-antigen ligase family protein [Longimicrobium sp.]|nr:O-antigen ligase family protein [Longimicrobium sp.]